MVLNRVLSSSGKLRSCMFDMFTYSTVRSASIQSTYVGIVYRIVQLILLAYIIGWELYHNKGYQAFDTVSSVVTTKVKGLGYVAINQTRDTSLNKSAPDYYQKMFAVNEDIEYKIFDTAGKLLEYNQSIISP